MIKKILKLFMVITFVLTSMLFGKNNEEIYLQANEFYKNGNYDQACQLYKQIDNPSAQIYYNMGNCAYKLGNYGYALLYWKRAEKNWGLFNREDLTYNLRLLERQLFEARNKGEDSDSAKLNELKFTAYLIKSQLYSTAQSIPLLALQIIFLFLWILLFLYKRYLYKKQKKIIIVILFILLATSGAMIALKYSINLHEKAIVITKQATVFSGPDRTYQEIGIIPEATEVIVKKASGAFSKIKRKRMVGWVDSKTIEKI